MRGPGWTGSWPGDPATGPPVADADAGPFGKIIGDFTVSCLSETEFQLTASYGAQGWHGAGSNRTRWTRRPVENISDARSGFQIAGPKARELLARVTRADVSRPRRSNSWT
jgi:glycine cleavage system aminomethyltransferase T